MDLFAEMNRAFPVPEKLHDGAMTAFDHRAPDLPVLDLVEDRWTATGHRLLQFESSGLGVGLDLETETSGAPATGTVAPPPDRAWLQTPEEVVAVPIAIDRAGTTPHGDLRLPGVPCGPVRLLLEIKDPSQVHATPWLLLRHSPVSPGSGLAL